MHKPLKEKDSEKECSLLGVGLLRDVINPTTISEISFLFGLRLLQCQGQVTQCTPQVMRSVEGMAKPQMLAV